MGENHKPLGYGTVYSHSACTEVLLCDQLPHTVQLHVRSCSYTGYGVVGKTTHKNFQSPVEVSKVVVCRGIYCGNQPTKRHTVTLAGRAHRG